MEMEDHHQQQPQQQHRRQQQLHSSVVDGIARLTDRRYRKEKHKLIVDGDCEPPVDGQSLEHLVNFLDGDSHEVTELQLVDVRLSHPSDGCVNVLRDFFSRSDTTLTKVTMIDCNFGSQEDASRLIAAFQPSRTVSDFTARTIRSLEGAVLGACLSSLMQNMPQLQRLACYYSNLRVEGVRALHPALQANRTLHELNLGWCNIGDEGIRIIADALVGNTTMQILSIGANGITSLGLADITRVIESTRLKTIDIGSNRRVFDNEASTQRFARILSRHEFLKELRLYECHLENKGIRLIVDGLVGNTTLDALDISWNRITSVGLADITRLFVSTQLKMIALFSNLELLNDEDVTQHFVSTLQHKKSCVQELPFIGPDDFPGDEDSHTATLASINNSLKRNQQLNHVNLLLAPPPPHQQQNHHGGAAMMMFKTWHNAIMKFAMVPNNAGASAIFKLFTARPQLLEKRLKRPAVEATSVAAAVSRPQQGPLRNDDVSDDEDEEHNCSGSEQQKKRQRLL